MANPCCTAPVSASLTFCEVSSLGGRATLRGCARSNFRGASALGGRRTFLKGQAPPDALFLKRDGASPNIGLLRGRFRRLHVASVLKESQDLALGTRAPDFSLSEPLTGRQWTLADFEGHPALLVAFICNHCPYVVHIRDEFLRLSGHYTTKEGLGVVAISSNSILTHPQDGPDFMAKDAKQLAMPFPYLYDETQEVAKAYKAACTPDFYIFKKDGRRPFELVYHGQFDDSRPRNGKPVTGRDLRVALDCTLSGRPYPHQQRPSIGCNIKWSPGNEPEYF